MATSPVIIEAADPSGREGQACIQAYVDELQARFEEGFDPARSVSAEPEELVPPAGRFLLARLDGVAVGCAGLKIHADGVGELKRMWVAPSVRGRGIAQRLLESLEALAAAAGWRCCGSIRTAAWSKPMRCTGATAMSRSRRTTTTATPITGSKSAACSADAFTAPRAGTAQPADRRR